MKRVFAILLSLSILLVGCGANDTSGESSSDSSDNIIYSLPVVDMTPTYTGLNDQDLLGYIEDLVYMDTVKTLNSTEYVVEGVNTVFVSKEYLEELEFNSQSNIFFGYTLDELNTLFEGTKYIFTLGEDGQTDVREMEIIEDASTATILKNVAIGTGVILVCVTVSCLTAGSAPAVSLIFAASAKGAATMAASAGSIGAISSGIVRYIQTGDLEESLRSAALSGSEAFKWGAISGALISGGTEAFALHSATQGGLTMNEVALIQKESNLPLEVISRFHSVDEYRVYQTANLKSMLVNGKTALIQSVDLDFVSELPDGSKVTNLARMQSGYAPIDPATGKAYQLHHIGQTNDATLAILTEEQHQGNASILNIFGKESEIDRSAFAKIREDFWKDYGNQLASGGVID